MTPPGLLDCMKTVIARDVRIALRRRTDVMTSLIFFVIVVSLFPLGIGADPVLLRTLGATRRQLMQIQLVEYAILGVLAAVVDEFITVDTDAVCAAIKDIFVDP